MLVQLPVALSQLHCFGAVSQKLNRGSSALQTLHELLIVDIERPGVTKWSGAG